MSALLVVSGPSLGDYFRLGRSSIVIGRSERSAIQLLDDLASRRHAVLAYDKDRRRYHLRDLQSINGTRVNDVLLGDEVALADGDLVRIGSTEMLFSMVDYVDADREFDCARSNDEAARATAILDRSALESLDSFRSSIIALDKTVTRLEAEGWGHPWPGAPACAPRSRSLVLRTPTS